MNQDILTLCTPLLQSHPSRRLVMNRYFPISFWLMNILELDHSGIFKNKSSRWVMNFLTDHLNTRASCFASLYRRLHPRFIGLTLENFVPTNLSGGYCNHCGQCCFFFGGLGEFPEPWPFPNRWRRLFTNGLGRHHLFCVFLWEWHRSAKGFCAIYRWRPLVCNLFGEDECRYYLDAPHLPYVHFDRVSWYLRTIVGRL